MTQDIFATGGVILGPILHATISDENGVIAELVPVEFGEGDVTLTISDQGVFTIQLKKSWPERLKAFFTKRRLEI